MNALRFMQEGGWIASRYISQIAVDAIRQCAAEVRGGQFPHAERSYAMKPEEIARTERAIGRKLN
jgi:ketopantoate hydroxymethyltransferase